MFERIFDKNKKERGLKDIHLNEVSFVNKPASKLPFLIVKSEAGESLNDLDELLSCESFSDEDVEIVDGIMKQIGDLDDDTASAIGDLLLCVSAHPVIAKSCDVENWSSLTGIELVDIPCLIEKAELNQVEEFIQKFAAKAQLQRDELEIIDNSLQVISDMDKDSLDAVYSLLKIEFSEDVINRRWPSMFRHLSESESVEQPVAKKSGLRWPSISAR